jgi:NAD-dependent dihydropyrimidine dehydrogenase PreA subunit
MRKFCLYADNYQSAPCITVKTCKYSYIQTFLNGDKKQDKDYSVPLKIDCLKIGINNKPSVLKERCINCMFCIFGCLGNKIIISDKFHPVEFCTDLSAEQRNELHNNLIVKLFKGNFIKLPSVPISAFKIKYKTFSEFTSVDETENIAVWGINAMKYLSRSLEPRISLEIGLKIQERDRGRRIDISLLNISENYLFLVETKVNFEKMMSEKRYISQLLDYETEMKKINLSNIKKCKFLMIGGEESTLLPPNHPDCTSKVGNEIDNFYDILQKNQFFFISANAMLALGLMKLFVSCDKYNLENLFPIITNRKYVGLLSSGVVNTEGEITPLDEIIGT